MPINWASVEEGAEVVEVSHEASHVISSASNVLVDREDMLWISGTLPQHIVIKIAEHHPPIRYVGWYAWQHYLTNPKVVEVSSGVVEGCFSPLIVCTGLPGAGKQLWELEEPIPSSHVYIKFKVTATFGATSTYMNRVYLYAEHPGDGFSAPSNALPSANELGPQSPLKMTSILKELDEEIKMLHPLRNISPSRMAQTHSAHSTSVTASRDAAEAAHAAPPPQSWGGTSGYEWNTRSPGRREYGGRSVSGTETPPAGPAWERRISGLENSVQQLIHLIHDQRHEMDDVRHLLLRPSQSQEPSRQAAAVTREGSRDAHLEPRRPASGYENADVAKSAAASSTQLPKAQRDRLYHEFPEEALRHYVEEVMAPRLEKYRARIEARVLQRVDEAVHAIEKDVRRMVEDRVRRYIYEIAQNREHPLHSGLADNGGHRGEQHHHHSHGGRDRDDLSLVHVDRPTYTTVPKTSSRHASSWEGKAAAPVHPAAAPPDSSRSRGHPRHILPRGHQGFDDDVNHRPHY